MTILKLQLLWGLRSLALHCACLLAFETNFAEMAASIARIALNAGRQRTLVLEVVLPAPPAPTTESRTAPAFEVTHALPFPGLLLLLFTFVRRRCFRFVGMGRSGAQGKLGLDMSF